MNSLPAELQGKPKHTGVGSLSLLQRIFQTQESTCTAGRFFTIEPPGKPHGCLEEMANNLERLKLSVGWM